MLTTSSRTAWPKWRVVSPERSAWRRLVTSLVDLEVGVAGDAELRERLDLAAREQRAEVGADHARQQHERLAVPLARARQPDDARQHARHLDDRRSCCARPNASLPARRAMKLSDLLATCGNGCDGSRPTGTSSGRTCGLEERARPSAARRALRSAWLRMRMPALGERRHHLVVEDRVLLVDQRVRRGGERLDVGRRRAAVRAARARLEAVGEADLEELVEVRRDDAHVAQPLEQRHVGAARLRQHAPVELEDRALAVQQRRHRHARRAAFALGHPRSLGRSRDDSMTRRPPAGRRRRPAAGRQRASVEITSPKPCQSVPVKRASWPCSIGK